MMFAGRFGRAASAKHKKKKATHEKSAKLRHTIPEYDPDGGLQNYDYFRPPPSAEPISESPLGAGNFEQKPPPYDSTDNSTEQADAITPYTTFDLYRDSQDVSTDEDISKFMKTGDMGTHYSTNEGADYAEAEIKSLSPGETITHKHEVNSKNDMPGVEESGHTGELDGLSEYGDPVARGTLDPISDTTSEDKKKKKRKKRHKRKDSEKENTIDVVGATDGLSYTSKEVTHDSGFSIDNDVPRYAHCESKDEPKDKSIGDENNGNAGDTESVETKENDLGGTYSVFNQLNTNNDKEKEEDKRMYETIPGREEKLTTSPINGHSDSGVSSSGPFTHSGRPLPPPPDKNPSHNEQQQTCQDRWIRLNIGGMKFFTTVKSLARVPESKLARIVKNNNTVPPNVEREYRFDRNPQTFGFILDFYRSGELHLPQGVCIPFFKNELDFWGIPESALAPCCWEKYRTYAEDNNVMASMDTEEKFNQEGLLPGCATQCHTCREKVWRVLEYPSSSLGSQVSFSLWSVHRYVLVSVHLYFQ